MANEVVIRKQPDKIRAPVARAVGTWDPFQAMRELFRWEPFQLPVASAFPELGSFVPRFDVKETKESFVFSADLPGIAEKDVQVQLSENRLSISGHREAEKTEQNDTYYASERSYGSFTRSFVLPEGVDADKAHAELKHGVLKVAVPKRPEAQPRQIAVSTK